MRRGDSAENGGHQALQSTVLGASVWDLSSVGGLGTVAAIRGQTAIVLRDGGFGERAVNNRRDEEFPDGAALGDRVHIEIDDGVGRITRILPRTTKLVRLRPEDGRMALAKEHVIAANVEVAVIVASTTSPPFRQRLIDRYLVMCQYGEVEPVICVNKIDLARPDETALATYSEIGVRHVPVSAESGEGISRISDLLRGKKAVLAGHSGVGKSSIVNAITGGGAQHVGAVGTERRGQHTTTSSTMVEWAPESFLIDTPGIRSLGLWDIDGVSLRGYFPEFDEHRSGCRFPDCSHSHEPECGVRDAAATGKVIAARYDSYLRMLNE